MATLYMVCGMAGAGKSTLTTRLAAEHKAVRLSPDEWLKALLVDENDRAEMARMRPIVTELQWMQIQRLLRVGCHAIWEAGFWLRGERDMYLAGARDLGANVVLHYLTAPLDVLKQRIARRNEQLPPDSFHIAPEELDEWMEWLDVPTKSEGARFDAFHVHSFESRDVSL